MPKRAHCARMGIVVLIVLYNFCIYYFKIKKNDLLSIELYKHLRYRKHLKRACVRIFDPLINFLF